MAKSVGTNHLYQSTFMPIFQKAETKIKTLILTAFLLNEPLSSLRVKIAGVIAWVSLNIPKDLKDRNSYLRGIKLKSEQFIVLYYKQPQKTYNVAKTELLRSIPENKKPPIINTPEQLLEIVQKKPKDLWAAAKGSPNVVNYEKELKKKLNELANAPMTTYEKGKKPIELWQKAELDVRYDAQMEKLDQLKKDGVEYAWTSSHPNCSKRCEKWQGKLMALTGHAKGGNFQITTIDGHPVFSLTDIMDQTDEYGYHNNIICGFNCSHRLIPYKKGVYPPPDYTKKEIEQQRKIESQIRAMERQIRKLKTKETLLRSAGMTKSANELRKTIIQLESKYKQFCETNGYAWYSYRIDI